jgi:hypothetical protein
MEETSASSGSGVSRGDRITLTAAAVLAVLFVAGYWYHNTRTPTGTIKQLRRSVESHDLQSFRQYVDVEAVVSTAFSEWLSDQSKEPLGVVLMLSQRETLKEQWVHSIESSVEGQYGFVQTFFGEKAEIKTQKVKRDGAVAVVSLSISPGSASWEGLPVNLLLRRTGGRWKVVSIGQLHFLASLSSAMMKQPNEETSLTADTSKESSPPPVQTGAESRIDSVESEEDVAERLLVAEEERRAESERRAAEEEERNKNMQELKRHLSSKSIYRLEPASRDGRSPFYHHPECLIADESMQLVSPTVARMQGGVPHSCVENGSE